MNSYYGYGYAHPYYYPSVGAWPWGYVGQAPPPAWVPPQATQAPENYLLEALTRRFMESKGRSPTKLELADFAFDIAMELYFEKSGIREGPALARIRSKLKPFEDYVRGL